MKKSFLVIFLLGITFPREIVVSNRLELPLFAIMSAFNFDNTTNSRFFNVARDVLNENGYTDIGYFGNSNYVPLIFDASRISANLDTNSLLIEIKIPYTPKFLEHGMTNYVTHIYLKPTQVFPEIRDSGIKHFYSIFDSIIDSPEVSKKVSFGFKYTVEDLVVTATIYVESDLEKVFRSTEEQIYYSLFRVSSSSTDPVLKEGMERSASESFIKNNWRVLMPGSKSYIDYDIQISGAEFYEHFITNSYADPKIELVTECRVPVKITGRRSVILSEFVVSHNFSGRVKPAYYKNISETMGRKVYFESVLVMAKDCMRKAMKKPQ